MLFMVVTTPARGPERNTKERAFDLPPRPKQPHTPNDHVMMNGNVYCTLLHICLIRAIHIRMHEPRPQQQAKPN